MILCHYAGAPDVLSPLLCLKCTWCRATMLGCVERPGELLRDSGPTLQNDTSRVILICLLFIYIYIYTYNCSEVKLLLAAVR